MRIIRVQTKKKDHMIVDVDKIQLEINTKIADHTGMTLKEAKPLFDQVHVILNKMIF